MCLGVYGSLLMVMDPYFNNHGDSEFLLIYCKIWSDHCGVLFYFDSLMSQLGLRSTCTLTKPS